MFSINIQFIDLANSLWSKTLEKLRHDFYHLPGYVGLEAKRMDARPEAILISEGEKIFFLPYILRNCKNLFPV